MITDYSICIPTCKPMNEVQELVDDIRATIPSDIPIFTSGYKVSASVNRNFCLMKAKTKYVIMLDDDISGFTCGWAEGMLEPFELCNNVAMVSARLMRDRRTPGIMMSIDFKFEMTFQLVKEQFLPSSCIAFVNDGTRFDENYVGSGWEDTDYCESLQRKYPQHFWLINNNVQLIHANEMKNGQDGNYQINQRYYKKKWGGVK